MGEGYPPQDCRWVSQRLPLLSGGELTGNDRRRVERHLLACPSCRDHRAALDSVLNVLHLAAAEPPAALAPAPARAATTAPTEVVPSLWPALRRQIREERHAPRSLTARVLDRLDAWLDDLSARLGIGFGPPAGVGRPAAALVATLGVAMALTASAGLAVRARPSATLASPTASAPIPPLAATPSLTPTPTPSVAAGPPPVAMANVSAPAATPATSPGPAVSPTVSAPAGPVHGDLDHGTPMGPDTPAREAIAF